MKCINKFVEHTKVVMAWKIRSEELSPDYDKGRKYYFGEQHSHIDFCDVDELSMLELHAMANEIGVKEYICFYYSQRAVDDSSQLRRIENDMDVLNMKNCLDKNMMVGVYVEHERPIPPTDNEAENVENNSEFPNGNDEDKTNTCEGSGNEEGNPVDVLEYNINTLHGGRM